MTPSKPLNNGGLTFVGFGFGPIQAGLFVLEALRSGNFRRVVVAEVLPHVVEGIRRGGGKLGLNIAHLDQIESLALGPIDIEDPSVPSDRERLIRAVAEASEIATAVPSVRFYESQSPGSIHRILAQGLARRRGKPAVVYTAENDNRAAEILASAVLPEVPPAERDLVRRGTRFLNTVIGKMSLVVADPKEVRAAALRTVTASDPRAFLVESFNHTLISAIDFPVPAAFRRGIEIFEEKSDLLPFEEAKLYGHNAIHALAAYLAAQRQLVRIEELKKVPGAVDFIREAFLHEAGEALERRWKGVDPLFTPAGFQAHVDDLLERILNPFLGDLVERVARDPERKLGWDDRLVGAVRLALRQGITPRRLGIGVAAALAFYKPEVAGEGAGTVLEEIWRPARPDPGEAARVIQMANEGMNSLKQWLSGGIDIFSLAKE